MDGGGMIDPGATALYRFYNAADELLYIGITNRIPRRLGQHSDTKPWYTEVATITVEHHPTRMVALNVEKRAIKAEHPRYNVVHNDRPRSRRAAAPSGQWTFSSRRTGNERTTELHLMPELDCSSMVDDYGYLDGEGQLQEYVEYLEENHPEWLQANAVPILWSVEGRATFENAPFQEGQFGRASGRFPFREDFLTAYTWPYNEATGDMVDWFKLPFRYRFPEFSEALGWTPSPLQPTCPLLSVLANRDGLELPHGQQTEDSD